MRAVEPAALPALLRHHPRAGETADAGSFARALIATRRRFGITRVGALTRLDDCGVAVVQAVRPASLSLVASQGEGLTPAAAAVPAVMEAIERLAAEEIAPDRVRTVRPDTLAAALLQALERTRTVFDPGWRRRPLPVVDGWDLFAARVVPVPLALVDDRYIVPSPHEPGFPRTTTGLAAARSTARAVVAAGLEVLERDAVAADDRRGRARLVSASGVGGPRSRDILDRLEAAGLVAGIWRLPAPHGLPVYRCHVMEGEGRRELAPLPGEGSACRFSADRALAAALLEAAGARLVAIAGTREDITSDAYCAIDRAGLAAWRATFARGGVDAGDAGGEPTSDEDALATVCEALGAAGAAAAIVVPLATDVAPGLSVVRLVAPPLRHSAGH